MEFSRPLPNRDYKVLIRTITYNHSKYIKQSLDGFVLQRTNFPFVCVVLEDCSTDGEQDVIIDWINHNCKGIPAIFNEEYGAVYVVSHKDNSNCILVFYLLKENHRSQRKPKDPYAKPWFNASKYIALCEGDDYWTDPMKLQKQADFLDTHSDYSAVATQSMVIYESGERSHPFSKHIKECDWDVGTLMGERQFHTATIMYRPYPELDCRPKVYSGDVVLITTLSLKGKWRLMPQITCVYRKHSSGDSSNVKLSDLKRDLAAIPFYLKINPKFPERKYRAYLNYTFSIFPPRNGVKNILKYGIISVYYSLTCIPIDAYQALKTIYYMIKRIKKNIEGNNHK